MRGTIVRRKTNMKITLTMTTTIQTTMTTTTTMLRTCLSKKGGLDSKGSVRSVELNPSELWRLNTSTISMRNPQ